MKRSNVNGWKNKDILSFRANIETIFDWFISKVATRRSISLHLAAYEESALAAELARIRAGQIPGELSSFREERKGGR